MFKFRRKEEEEEFARFKSKLDSLHGVKKVLTFQMDCLEAKNKNLESELENNKELRRQFKADTEKKLSENKTILENERKSFEFQFIEQIKEKDALLISLKSLNLK